MTAISLTAASVHHAFVAPAARAQIANRRQARLVHNPSPQIDSLVEHLRELAKLTTGRAHDHVAAAARLVAELADSNAFELELEGRVHAAADGLARELRGNELNGRPPVLNARRIAGLLREPLRLIGQPADADPLAFVRAVRTVQATIDACWSELLLSGSVEHELGATKFALLTRLAGATE